MEVFIVTFPEADEEIHGVFASREDAMEYVESVDGTLDDYYIDMWLVGTGID